MSGVINELMRFENMYLSSVPDKKVCAYHIDDVHIKQFIRRNSEKGFCDYCKRNVQVIELERLMVFIMEGISNFYCDAVHFMSYNSREGGYLGQIYDKSELIIDEVGLDIDPDELLDDIVNSIDDVAWSDPDKHYGSESDFLKYQWTNFSQIVKHKSRYLFYSGDFEEDGNVLKILNEVGRIVSSLRLVQRIQAGTVLYRCRQHCSSDKVKNAEDIVSPPISRAIISNRFSPSGIPMFYGASDESLAILETISYTDTSRDCITTGKFELKEDIFVVDFCRLPEIPSIFGLKDKKKYYLICFLHELVNDFTKEIEKDGQEHIEYVPTQIITEFLRFPFNEKRKTKIQGLVYPSSKDKRNSATVLFWNNKESLENLLFKGLKEDKIDLL